MKEKILNWLIYILFFLLFAIIVNIATFTVSFLESLVDNHLFKEEPTVKVTEAQKGRDTQSKIQIRNETRPRKYYRNRNLTFYGYDCTVDCSGHEAGYEWAQDNDVNDIYDCDGDSISFIEGCQAYVEENY